MSRIAVGGTINKVIKRDFSRNLRLLDYKTTTGFLSLYYASPLYNYDFALHIGKYLAKDKGATFEVRRTFDNGFSIGAFATFTNVSASDFGEGVLIKGYILRYLLTHSRNMITRALTLLSFDHFREMVGRS